MDNSELTATAARAVEELKKLFLTDEATFWVMPSPIEGTSVLKKGSSGKLSHSVKKFTNSRVESSKVDTVVSIKASSLIAIFSDPEKWKTLFPTIVNTARTIPTLGSETVWEQELHMLSPLVPARKFTIVRCCRKIEEGVWIIADVSHGIVYSNHQASQSCYKRPSGVLIRALPYGRSKVTWIEHVEVSNIPSAYPAYRDLVKGGSSGGSGYGAKRWIVTLERMCARINLSSATTIPVTDRWEIPLTVEGRRSVMKLGERMLKNFSEMLIMPGNTEFPQKSRCGGVRISTRVNEEVGQVTGSVASAAYCLPIPSTPSQVFSLLRSNDFRHQWDVLCHGNAITETGRISTGLSATNHISLLKLDGPETMMELQECYMDALGGMIVYAPLDMAAMSIAASGRVDPLEIPILPSGFTISSDAPGTMDRGTLLTLAFQILLSTGQNSGGRMVSENSVMEVDMLISTVVQKIKALFNLPPE
ncbi:unnamed protein product [Eruca vesicaria subsp. sativa]|uniref:START domain-containing protein n=1 Tax=Eruca vesicaria subsp. sativa TaxID=29727 RepID=A0ABC8JZK8_ERUVS|nr:unnamed protein product [Eruca vesicaria subsp. sativa]